MRDGTVMQKLPEGSRSTFPVIYQLISPHLFIKYILSAEPSNQPHSHSRSTLLSIFPTYLLTHLPSIHLFTRHPIYPLVHPPAYPPIHPPAYPLIHPLIHTTYPPTYQHHSSTHPPTYPRTHHLSTHPPIHTPIHLSTPPIHTTSVPTLLNKHEASRLTGFILQGITITL